MCASKCVCVKAQISCVFVCACRLSETDGSGALHTHVWAPLMPAYCVVTLRVCSVVGVFLPACVCRGSVLFSAVTGNGAAGPDGIGEGSASREGGWAHMGTPQTTHSFKAFLMLLNWNDTLRLTHCFLYCLIKDALIFLKELPIIFCGYIWEVHSLQVNYWVQLSYTKFIIEEWLKIFHQHIAIYCIRLAILWHWL